MSDGGVRVHGSSWSYRWNEVGAAFARVLPAASAKSHRKVARVIASDFATCDVPRAHSYLRVADALTSAKLGIDHIRELYEAATRRADHYRIGMLEILGPVSADAMTKLREEAAGGNSGAVRALLVAGSRDNDDFIALGKSAAKSVHTMIEDARGKDGSIAMTGHVNDQLDDLVLAALNTNDARLWHEVTDALEACVIEETQQQRAIRRLASQFLNLPSHVQARLRRLAPTLHGRNFGSPLGGPNEYAGAVTHLRIAAGTVPDLEVEALLLSKRRDNQLAFVRTLAAWNSERKLPFLMTMVVDENPAVRTQAGFSLIEHAHQFPADRDRAYAAIRSTLPREEGCALPDGVAQGLAKYPTKETEDLEMLLRDHHSAIVRARFARDD